MHPINHESGAEILETLASKERREMTVLAARQSLREYAADQWPHTNHKGRLAKLCRLLPWSDRRVRAVYNGERGVSLRAEEQAALDQLTIEAKHEYRTIEALCAGLEALLTHTDEDGYRAQIDALRAVYRGMDSARAAGGKR